MTWGEFRKVIFMKSSHRTRHMCTWLVVLQGLLQHCVYWLIKGRTHTSFVTGRLVSFWVMYQCENMFPTLLEVYHLHLEWQHKHLNEACFIRVLPSNCYWLHVRYGQAYDLQRARACPSRTLLQIQEKVKYCPHQAGLCPGALSGTGQYATLPQGGEPVGIHIH